MCIKCIFICMYMILSLFEKKRIEEWGHGNILCLNIIVYNLNYNEIYSNSYSSVLPSVTILITMKFYCIIKFGIALVYKHKTKYTSLYNDIISHIPETIIFY